MSAYIDITTTNIANKCAEIISDLQPSDGPSTSAKNEVIISKKTSDGKKPSKKPRKILTVRECQIALAKLKTEFDSLCQKFENIEVSNRTGKEGTDVGEDQNDSTTSSNTSDGKHTSSGNEDANSSIQNKGEELRKKTAIKTDGEEYQDKLRSTSTRSDGPSANASKKNINYSNKKKGKKKQNGLH